MTYQLSQDLVEQEIADVRVLNVQMSTITHRINAVLDSRADLNQDFRLILRFLLKSFLSTHGSIIAILRHENVAKYDGDSTKNANVQFVADAMSLLREQLEKVFVIALLCDDPEIWIARYLKDDWRRAYIRFMFERDERRNLTRFDEFSTSVGPEIIENIRIASGVSAKEKQAVEFKYANPNSKLPAEHKAFDIKLFPTPGRAVNEMTEPGSQPFLKRLHHEYETISGYTHVGHSKLQLLMMSDRLFGRNIDVAEVEDYYKKEIESPAVLTSYLCHAVAASEVFKLMTDEIEVLAALTTQWETLKKGSLLAIALWDLRGKHLFPSTIGHSE